MSDSVSLQIDLPTVYQTPSRFAALFATVLYRYLGYEIIEFDIVFVGSENTEHTPTQLIRLDLSDDPSFLKLIAKIEEVIGSVTGPKSQITCCMSQQYARIISVRLDGPSCHKISLSQGNQGTALLIFEGAANIEEMNAFATHTLAIGSVATVSPDAQISRLQMLTLDELQTGNMQDVLTPFKRSTIPAAFEEQVRLTPSAAALRWSGVTVTYRELHEKAQNAATNLRHRLIRAETLVGICLDDPVATASAYLGVLLAGGVILALDHEWPAEVLHQRIREASPKWVITSAHCWPALDIDLTEILFEESLAAKQDSSVLPQAELTPDSAAYVVFTSGSTGVPKGIVGLHRTITSSRYRSHAIEDREVFALSADLAFGAGLIGLFFALLRGACVVLVSRSITKDLFSLIKVWKEERVTRLVLVAPQLRQLALMPPSLLRELDSVTTLALSGAVLTPDLLETAYAAFPQARIVNAYTCLEVGTMSTRWEATPNNKPSRLNVGRALPSIRIYIFGPKMNLLPTGMPGEIGIGSADLSRGYLNQPDWTRDRFITNAVNDPEIPRIFRTGDLGRLLKSGELEYLGRIDNQIKIRGRRVEVEEIETVLCGIPEVHQAAVIAYPNAADLRLTAFLSLKPNQEILIKTLREYVAARLPEYMVPSLFVLRDELPLTANGKIDRQAFSNESNRPELDTLYVAPRSSIENTIRDIWESVLGIQGIGMKDHFLEIGGDSLLAIRIAILLQEEFDCILPAITVFSCPTIEELAAEVSLLGVEQPLTVHTTNADPA
jgi:amino acid adenylation domain-containing protein